MPSRKKPYHTNSPLKQANMPPKIRLKVVPAVSEATSKVADPTSTVTKRSSTVTEPISTVTESISTVTEPMSTGSDPTSTSMEPTSSRMEFTSDTRENIPLAMRRAKRTPKPKIWGDEKSIWVFDAVVNSENLERRTSVTNIDIENVEFEEATSDNPDVAEVSPRQNVRKMRQNMHKQTGSPRKKWSSAWKDFTPCPDKEGKATCNLCHHEISFVSTVSNLKMHLKAMHPEDGTTKVRKLSKPPKPRERKSIVWQHFADSETNKGYAVCGYCCKEVSCRTTISNLKHHLKLMHPGVIEGTVDLANLTAKDQIVGRMSLTRERHACDALVQLFYKSYHSLGLVDSSSFTNFVDVLNPHFDMPERDTLDHVTLRSHYRLALRKAQEKMKGAATVCLTTDFWASIANVNFISVAAHFVTESMQFHSVMLECTEIGHNEVSEIITQITSCWGITGKVTLVVTGDDGDPKDSSICGLQWPQFPCYGRSLNLLLQTALQVAAGLRSKVRNMVLWFKNDALATSALMIAQEPSPKELLDAPEPRWDVAFDMFKRCAELEPAIKVTMASLSSDIPCLTDLDWKECHELIEVLLPFEEIINQLRNKHYILGSQVMVLTQGLLSVIEELKTRQYEEVPRAMVAVLESGLKSMSGSADVAETMSLATFLDPRFKGFAFPTEAEAEKVHDQLTLMVTLQEAMTQDEEKLPSGPLSAWAQFQSKMLMAKTEFPPDMLARAELKGYMEEAVLDLEQDPFEWWQTRRHVFPHLAKIAREKLGIVATSIPSEQIFARDREMVFENRGRLTAEETKKLVFLNINCKT